MSQNIQDTAEPSVETQKSQEQEVLQEENGPSDTQPQEDSQEQEVLQGENGPSDTQPQDSQEQEVPQDSEVDGPNTQIANEDNPITDIQVSLNKAEGDSLRKQGFCQIKVDLNKGAGGDYIYIWYRKRSCGSAITRVQFSFNDKMCKGLEKAGYKKVDKDLNAGAEGNTIYLWFYRGETRYDVPILDLKITTCPDEEVQMFDFSFERLACDLNRRAGGDCILLWLKRAKPTYICDITATSEFDQDVCLLKEGYIRMDEDTNRGTRGSYIFIWYRLTADREKGINDIQVSIDDNNAMFLKGAGYHQVEQDLNEKTEGPPVYLWYRKDRPIQNFCLIVKEVWMGKYKDVVHVIMKNLNKGNEGSTEYLSYRRHAKMKNVGVTLMAEIEKEMFPGQISGDGEGTIIN